MLGQNLNFFPPSPKEKQQRKHLFFFVLRNIETKKASSDF